MIRSLLAALAAAFFLIPATGQSQPIEQTVEDHRDDRGEIDRSNHGFIHRPSGYAFPAFLGEMPARKTYTYGPGNASLYYTLYGGANGDAWLSLYVYPALTSVEAHSVEIEEALLGRMPGTAIEPPHGAPATPGGAAGKWYDSTADGIAVLSGYRLVRSGDWFIKVRVTVPKSGGQSALDRALRGFAAVPWSVPPEPARMRAFGR
ncbi:MAG TPA: hypothetical protein VMK31_06485 [Sphingomicrobium sp.]|nr:hypothetical protein [Sphingomicrobium sp.]